MNMQLRSPEFEGGNPGLKNPDAKQSGSMRAINLCRPVDSISLALIESKTFALKRRFSYFR